MGKKYQLPKKIVSATESDTDATDVAATDVTAGGEQQMLPHSFPIPTTNFRRDFEDAAAQLNEKLQIGKTPVRKEKPKSTLRFNKKGYLEGEIDSVDEGTGKPDTVDLSKQAKTVNEGVKRPVFKKKSAQPKEDEVDSQETMLGTSSPADGSNKDESQSEDKEPKEAVACETGSKRKYPTFNKREQAFINAGDASAVRRAMRAGDISRVRGNQILDTMGALENIETGVPATENTAPAFGAIIDWLSEQKITFADCIDEFKLVPDEQGEYSVASFIARKVTREKLLDWINKYPQVAKDYKDYFRVSATEDAKDKIFPRPTDAGKPLEGDLVSVEEDAEAGPQEDLYEKWTIKMTPEMRAKIAKDLPADEKQKLSATIENLAKGYGCSVKYTGRAPLEGQISHISKDTASELSASLESFGCVARVISGKEDCSIVFEEYRSKSATKWYALVKNASESTKISQLTITVEGSATESDVREYLNKSYGKGNVVRVATEKFS